MRKEALENNKPSRQVQDNSTISIMYSVSGVCADCPPDEDFFAPEVLPEDDFFSAFLNTTFVTELPINSFDNFRKVEEAAYSREPLEFDNFFTLEFSANCVDDRSFNDSRRI